MKGDATGDGGFDMVVVYLYTLWGHGGSPSSPLSLFIIDYYIMAAEWAYVLEMRDCCISGSCNGLELDLLLL